MSGGALGGGLRSSRWASAPNSVPVQFPRKARPTPANAITQPVFPPPSEAHKNTPEGSWWEAAPVPPQLASKLEAMSSNSFGVHAESSSARNPNTQFPGDVATSVEDVTMSESEAILATFGPPLKVIVDPAGDIILNIWGSPSKGVGVRLLAGFLVSRHVLLESITRNDGALKPIGNLEVDEFDIEEKNVFSLELLLRAFHNNMADATYDVSLEVVWNALVIGDAYFFKYEILKGFFAEWIDRKGGLANFDSEHFTSLVIPSLCYVFDHAEGFYYSTRRAVYESMGGVGIKIDQTRFDYVRQILPPRIISGLNAARGNLKTQLHNSLYINRRFYRATCPCKELGNFQFGLALDRTGVWPLEECLHGKGQTSITKILQQMATNFVYYPPNRECKLCSQDFGSTIVAPTIAHIMGSFGGLCLDCLEQESDKDKKYFNEEYVKNCRIKKHAEPTWYFSYISSRDRTDRREIERAARAKVQKENKPAGRKYQGGNRNGFRAPPTSLPSN